MQEPAQYVLQPVSNTYKMVWMQIGIVKKCHWKKKNLVPCPIWSDNYAVSNKKGF